MKTPLPKEERIERNKKKIRDWHAEVDYYYKNQKKRGDKKNGGNKPST